MLKQKLIWTDAYRSKRSEELENLMQEGWLIKIVTPIQEGRSCHTYTDKLVIVLEKDFTEEELKKEEEEVLNRQRREYPPCDPYLDPIRYPNTHMWSLNK